MLFFSYNDEPVKRQSIFEVDINGQPANQDDDDAPTDYTAGDDAGAEDTGAPADDAAAPNPNPAAPQAAQQDDTNPTDNPEDYTLPDTEDQGDEPPGGGMDTRMNTPAPTGAEGDGAAPADYTADTGGDAGGDMGGDPATGGGDPGDAGGDPGAGGEGGEGAPTGYTAGGGAGGGEGGDPGAGGDPAAGGAEGGGDPGAEGGDDAGGDMGGDDDAGSDDMGDDSGSSGDGYDQQIQDLDKDLYADLTEPQMDIRNKELKRNFASLYDMIQDIIERINDISKDTASVKPLEFVSTKLNDLADNVSDYLVYTYSTKSYTENEINYNLFLAAVHQINDVIAKIAPTHQ